MGKEKGKKEDSRKHKNDGTQPIVNVNVNCCDNKKEGARPSAFKAVNRSQPQSIGPADITQVIYPDEIFDLNNEYSQSTSTFTPKQDGIYLIIASLSFNPNVPSNYSLRMFIDLNGVEAAAADNDFFGEEVTVTSNLLSVSTITQLSKNDNVQIIAQATANGITVPGQSFMHFEAIRFPI